MDIYERIEENRTKIASIYDLAAICYDYLRMQIDNQALFLAEYIEYSEEAKLNNPNIRMLKRYSYEMMRLFLQKDSKYSVEEIVGETLRRIVSAREKLISYGTVIYNEATIAYYLLQAVDLYAENKATESSAAPLNENYMENSYIYRIHGETMITKAAVELEFRDKIRTTEIRHNFKCIRILEKAELDTGMSPPRLVTLHIDQYDQIRKSIIKSRKLKVAVIPFGREKVLGFEKVQGSSFRVQYMEQSKQTVLTKAINLLEKAIRQKANIIIFPEYVCFPEMQERIGDYLAETYRKTPDRMKSLFLVIAGSGWTEEDNNVARIYSYSGKLLGEQYKYSPYDGYDEKGERWIEGLCNPGKESVIVDIPEIGSIMTAICRDVSNRDQTEKIADIFEVDFLLVAAWSKSLHGGFEKQLENITEMNTTTSSLVCNSCAVVDESNWERGIVVTPYKKESIIQAKTKIIKSKAEQCEKCAGCIFRIPLSYNTPNVEKGKIVGKITQCKL